MKISLNWLRDYVDWTGSPEELEELLTRTGLSVESMEKRGAAFDRVVVAQILESTQHPNADRLSVCKVDDGSGQPRQIVCGAKNYKIGDKVPLALPGAVLPGDFRIKTGKLRGVESEGMLCSAKELRLAEDSDGLLILPTSAVPGEPVSNLFPADLVLDLEITPNRPDWLSHVGVAREISVFTNLPAARPAVETPAVASADESQVRIDDPDACPYYTLRRISGVKIGPSPDWLKRRLEAVGLRAINNVVDVTNYVMLEIGQPLHAFDAAKVDGGIVVRRAQAGESFPALNGATYTLNPDNLVIADSKQALALAGVMGGEGSGVSDTTAEILLESALFKPSVVRRTARSLDLHSDSSYRFERGVNPEDMLTASARATQLIIELAGGVAEGPVLFAGPLPETGIVLSLRHDRARGLLGIESLSDEEILDALKRVGLNLEETGKGTSQWLIPGYRADLRREVDLIEEVARVVGIEKIVGQAVGFAAPVSDADKAYDFQAGVRQKLAAGGFHEARTSTLVSGEMTLGTENLRTIRNPLGADQAILRPGLLPGLLAVVQRNLHNGIKTVRAFEIGRVFSATGCEESSKLAVAATGTAAKGDWRGGQSRELDLFDLKGILESLAPKRLSFESTAATGPFILAVTIRSNTGTIIGTAGQLHPAEARELHASGPVVAAEIDLTALQALASAPHPFTELPKYPAVTRDLAIVASADLAYAEIEKILAGSGEPLLTGVELFDVFVDPTGEKLPADKKSLAISLTFRSVERTLVTEEVNAAFERLRRGLKDRLAVDFRE